MIIDPTAAGGVTEAKLISGIDDHSRYSVIDKVVPRASARAVCTAFLAAVAEYGVRHCCIKRSAHRSWSRCWRRGGQQAPQLSGCHVLRGA